MTEHGIRTQAGMTRYPKKVFAVYGDASEYADAIDNAGLNSQITELDYIGNGATLHVYLVEVV